MTTAKLITVATRFKKSLADKEITNLAREVGFTQRLRQVTPIRVAASFVSCFASQRVESIADILRAFNGLSGRSVHYKPFHNQLSKDEFPKFMKGIFQRLLRELVVRVLKPLPDSALRRFEDIWIQDGTSFAIADALSDRFPGRFTKTKPAAVELHATMSVMGDQVLRVSLAPDRLGERDFLPEPENLRSKLLLADRGYFDLDYSRRVDEAKGSFIIRSTSRVNPMIETCYMDGHRVRRFVGMTVQYALEKLDGKSADIDVAWARGVATLRFRLIAIWNPATEDHLLLLTNLPRDQFSPEMVATLYRLRWQVELLFKEWKSYANLHAFQTQKAAIAEGLIWAALAAAVLKRFLAQAVEFVFGAATASTRRASMALSTHLPHVFSALLAERGVCHRMRELLNFLFVNARRAHPKRDRNSGRLQAGLWHAHVQLHHG